MSVPDYVLQKFSKEEMITMDKVIEHSAHAVEAFIESSRFDHVMNQYNGESQLRPIISDYIQNDKRFQELDDVFGHQNILVTGLSPSAKATIIAEKYLKDQNKCC